MPNLSAILNPQAWGERWRAARSARTVALPIRDWAGASAASTGQPTRIAGFDQSLVWIVVSLLALGLVMVYSASIALPDAPKFARYASTHFMGRHLMSIAIAVVAALLAVQVPINTWEKCAPWLFVAALLLLALVLVPHVGKGVNGARRWLPMGVMNFQPSELAKLAMAMYAASYMVRKMDVKERFVQAVWPMAVSLAVIGLLLLAEPDMGAFIVIATVALGILFLGGVNGKMFTLSFAVLVGAFGLMIALSPFRRERILAFLDP